MIITIIAGVGNSNANKIKNIEKLELIESKIIVDNTEWKNGFDYNGNYLIPANLFINSDNYKVNKVASVVYKNSTSYNYPYEITHDSEYKIYYVW